MAMVMMTVANFARSSRLLMHSSNDDGSSVIPKGIQLVQREYALLGLKPTLLTVGRGRIRQHTNPFSLALSVPVEIPKWDQIFQDPTLPLTVDIGCGSGRFLLWFANKFSQSNNYLGFEIRKGLVDRANIWAMELGLQNIYFMFANATITFDQLVVSYPGPLIFVSILCPDPYFKKRHHKRRVLQSNLVESIARNLSPGGKVFIQSDVCEVAIEMRNRFDALFDVFEHVDVGGGDNDDDNCLCDGEGWVLSNPMGLRTEREIHAESKGGKIYRRLYFKKMERDSNENHVYENL